MQLYTIFEFLSGPIKQSPMSKRGKLNNDSLIFVFLSTNTMSSINGFFRISTSASSLIIFFTFFSTSSLVSFSSQGMLVILRHVLRLYCSLLSIESSRLELFFVMQCYSPSRNSHASEVS